MFERAVIVNPGRKDGHLDLSRILDAMLYYKKIDIIIDASTFHEMWVILGKDGLRSLLNHPSLNVSITPENPAIINNTKNGIKTHFPAAYTICGQHGNVRRDNDWIGSLHQSLNNFDADITRSDVKNVVSNLKNTTFSKIFMNEKYQKSIFDSLIKDGDSMKLFLESYAASNGLSLNRNLLKEVSIESVLLNDGYLITNSIDLNKIVIGANLDGWDKIIPSVQCYGFDLQLSQTRSADIISSEINAYIASARIDLSLTRAKVSQDRQSAFEEYVFSEARAFGSAFNSGTIDIFEALQAIDKTYKFRDWLTEFLPDSDIISEYHRAISKESILSSLPAKAVRFSIFTGLGVAVDAMGAPGLGTVGGIALSAIDSFVVDNILRGWRPNAFVNTIKKSIDI